MPEEEMGNNGELNTAGKHESANRLPTLGWGLFFIWVAIVMLTNMSAGIGLLGVGIIILVLQIARILQHQKMEGFWVFVGLLLVIGGLWNQLEMELSLVPIILLIAGVVLIASTFRRRRS